MAWTWTSAKQSKNGAYVVTAAEGVTGDEISFEAHKDRVTPELLVEVLQEKVTLMNGKGTDEEKKLTWIQNNVDISGVE